jgi:hypothetical protein
VALGFSGLPMWKSICAPLSFTMALHKRQIQKSSSKPQSVVRVITLKTMHSPVFTKIFPIHTATFRAISGHVRSAYAISSRKARLQPIETIGVY